MNSSAESSMRRSQQLQNRMRQGKILRLPEGYSVQQPVVILEPAEIGEGTFIGCFAFIRERTTIGKNSVVGARALFV